MGRQFADGLTKESAAQLLADRLRTHRNRLVDDMSYQAARKKDPQRRFASATEFALSTPQASAAVFFATTVSSVTPAQAQPEHETSFDDVFLMLATLLLGLLLLKWLAAPLLQAAPAERAVFRGERTQATTLNQEQGPQAEAPSSDGAVPTSTPDTSDAGTN